MAQFENLLAGRLKFNTHFHVCAVLAQFENLLTGRLKFNTHFHACAVLAKDVILLVVGTVTCATLPGRVPEAMPRQRTPRNRARISVSRPSRLCPGRRRLSSVPCCVFCCRMLSYGVCRVRMQFVCGAGRGASEHEAFCVFIGMTYERSSKTCRLHWVPPA